jgi:hypothetical protein
MELYNRKAIHSSLKDKDHTSFKEGEFIEVCEWKNGEGFDVKVESLVPSHFQMTYGTFEILKDLIEQINK